MKKPIKIIAKTEIGKKALETNLKESLNKDKKDFMEKMQIKQTIINNDPYTLLLEIGNKVLASWIDPLDVIRKIDTAMKRNNAIKGVDYDIVY